MDPAIWQRVESLFLEAVDLDAEARARYLDDACGRDNALRAEVESLLRHAADTGRLDQAVAKVAGGTVRERAAIHQPGLTIGAYRLERVLGRGGMGTVWLARRADQAFEKQVAIKLLRRERATPGFIERFHRERNILARFEHPNIARLLDGGTTPEGEVFLVMERVDGEKITTYCDRLRLGITERLTPFLAVCEAVEHAHRQLVVHRDLKPSNILVSQTGEPKLLDFGIAKLLDSDDAERDPTLTAERLLTPRYASPEQLFGEPITTATDVYSLGVVLYELLVGRLPFAPQDSTYAELAQTMKERDAPAPSLRAASASIVKSRIEQPAGEPARRDAEAEGSLAADALAERRGTTPGPLRKRLRGDLDNIVLAALEKDPGRRYGSVERLAEDLRRHLEGLPIRARKQTAGYRLGKFVRRNRLLVALATTVATLLLSFSVVVAVQSGRVARERDRALLAEDQSNQVSAFLIDLFELSDPDRAIGETITAREILDRGAERVRAELADQPAVQAELLATIGRVYQNLALFEEAEALYGSALEIQRSQLGTERSVRQRLVVHLLDDIGQTRYRRGDLDGAEQAGLEALAVLERSGRPDPAALAEVTNNLGLIDLDRRQLDRAEQRFRTAIQGWSQSLGARHALTQVGKSNLAGTLELQERFDEAESLLRDVLDLRQAAPEGEQSRIANAHNKLGGLLHRRGRYGEAEQHLRAGLAIREKIFDPDHPSIGESSNNLASLLHDQGALDDAAPFYRRAIAIATKTHGETHGQVAINLNNLASLLEDRGDLTEAVSLYRRSLAIRLQLYDDDHPSPLRAEHNLGRALLWLATSAPSEAEARDAAREGERLVRHAYTSRVERLGAEHLDVASSLEILAHLHRRRRDVKAAIEASHRALSIREQRLGPEHPRVIRARALEASLACEDSAAINEPRSARAQQAVDTLRVLRDQALARIPPNPIDRGRVEIELGACLLALGAAEEAEEILHSGRDALTTAFGDAGPEVVHAQELLAATAGR